MDRPFPRNASSYLKKSAVFASVVLLFAAGAAWGPAEAAASRITLSASPGSVTLRRGTAKTVTLNVRRGTGYTAPLTLSGSSPRQGLRLSAKQNPLTGNSTVLTISAAAGTALGRTTLTVTARGGAASSSIRLTVNVTTSASSGEIPIPVEPAPGSGQISAAALTPSALSVAPGQTANVLVSTTGAAGGVPISYDVTGLPVGLLPEFFPNGTTVQIRFTASATLAAGAYPVVVRASQNGTVFSLGTLTVTVSGPTATTLAVTTTQAATTTTLATTTTIAPTTTTSTTSAPTTTIAPVGDLIVTRKVLQGTVCDALPITGTQNIGLTLVNTSTTPRTVTALARGLCTVSPFVPVVVAAGASVPVAVPVGTVLISRATLIAGLPIRRVMRVTAATTLDVGGTITVNVACTGPTSSTAVTLIDGQTVVNSAIAVGSTCTLTEVDGVGPTTNSTDNRSTTTDGVVTIAQRPPGCAVPTPATPNPSGTACYAEIVFNN